MSRGLRTWPFVAALAVLGCGLGLAIAGFPARGGPSTGPILTTTTTTAQRNDGTTTTTIVLAPLNRVTVLGDSYTGGSDMGGQDTYNWTRVATVDLSDEFRIRTNVIGAGGSGYVARGETDRSFVDLVKEGVSADDTLVVIFGSRNDIGKSLDDVRAAADSAYREVAMLAPDAALLVVGPPWTSEDVPEELTAIRDVLAEVARDHGATFVDPITDRWFFGADSALIGTDGVHPTNAGHEYMGRLLAPAIAAALPAANRIPA